MAPGGRMSSSEKGGRLRSFWSKRSRKEKTSLIASASTIVAALVAGVPAALLSPSNPGPLPSPATMSSSPTATPHTVSTVQGVIVQPASGVTMAGKTFLHASGTSQNVPADNRLWLFIQWNGVHTYWATNPNYTSLNRSDGHWSGKIYVGGSGRLTLWLVDLGPKALHVINTDVTGQNDGFPTLHLASDARILASIPFTAH